MTVWNEKIKQLSKRVMPWFLHGELREDAPDNIKKDWELLKEEYEKEKERQTKLCFASANT